MRRISRTLFLCLSVLGVAYAQASFEVASVKLHLGPITYSADPAVHGSSVTATASTLLDLITSAYGLRYDQVSGGPSWVNSDYYDIIAKAAGKSVLTMDQVRPMLQTLLAERFQVKVHRETKEGPVYALVVGKNGPKLKQVSPDADGTAEGIYANSSTMHMKVSKGTMEQLARRLSDNGAGRPVLDRTELKGFYSYTLDWANGTPGPDSDAPYILTAIQEQLGLKLESTKGPVEMLIIDHAEKPSEN